MKEGEKMEETKTCPKCGGETEQGRLHPIHLKRLSLLENRERRKRGF